MGVLPRLAILVLALGSALGCGAAERWVKCGMSCGTSGRCQPSSLRVDGGESFTRCYASSDADCRRSKICGEDGRCFASESGKCVSDPSKHGLCAGSFHCTRSGDCHPQPEGFCAPESDADCLGSERCASVPHACTYSPEYQRCVP